MPPTDALRVKLEINRSLLHEPLGRLLVDAYDRSLRGIHPEQRGPYTWHTDTDPLPIGPIGYFGLPYHEGDLAEYFENLIATAQAFYVSPQVNTLITAAAESMPNEMLVKPDLPSEAGLMFLPDGMAFIDVRGQMLMWKVVVWMSRAGGVDIFSLTDKYDDRDTTNLKLRQDIPEKDWGKLPRYTLNGYQRCEFGQKLPVALQGSKALPPELSRQLKVFRDDKTGSVRWWWPEGYDLNDWIGTNELRTDEQTQWLVACWRLMQQPITRVEKEHPERQLRRQAERIQMRLDPVSVIRLRAVRKETDGTREVVYSHAFWRRGHWRRQWYGSGEHRYQRAVWIHPTVVNAGKGLPMLAREHVYSFER